MPHKYLVTGGAGFLGSSLVIRLIQAGNEVRILDDQSRGSMRRLAAVQRDLNIINGDIRDPEICRSAVRGCDSVCHLAYVNGTENFYTKPAYVLEVGVKGITNVIDGCIREGVAELILVSSSEVYQTPNAIPTGEDVPLSIPDPHNPRYSYAAGKIISELMAINYGRKHFERVVIVRPHNVYGPDMGNEHVIPQLTLKLRGLIQRTRTDILKLPIQGDGLDTRAFVYVDDFTDGLMLVIRKGLHANIYNVGTMEEVTIHDLAHRIAGILNVQVELLPQERAWGSTQRRCPDIRKLESLGYRRQVDLNSGLRRTVDWYMNAGPAPLPVSSL